MLGIDKVICEKHDNIDVLGLSVRVHNAIRRAKLPTIGELLEFREIASLLTIRNLGEKGVAEIEEKLSSVELIRNPKVDGEHSDVDDVRLEEGDSRILVGLDSSVAAGVRPVVLYASDVIFTLQAMLENELRVRRLHPNVEYCGETLDSFTNANDCGASILYFRLAHVLSAAVSVSDELERILSSLTDRELTVLHRRAGFRRQTLDEIGKTLLVTRERVRQIEKRLMKRAVGRLRAMPLIRIRSAILLANDMELSFDAWRESLVRSGLLGDWTDPRYLGLDQIELMLAVCTLSADLSASVTVPNSLNYMLRLRDKGTPSVSAKVLLLLEAMPNDVWRLIRRHSRHSGAVSLEWIIEQESVPFDRKQIGEILMARDFFAVESEWYMSTESMPDSRHKNHVLHNSLIKMFQYCGPLSISDVYFGIEHTLIRTKFPVPPINVLQVMLANYGYKIEENLWYWDGDVSEELNSPEQVIWDTINGFGGVAHHSELMQAIVDSPLSSVSLHASLIRSPIFDCFEKGLYKIRGTLHNNSATLRARSAAERTPVNLSVNRDSFGNITIVASLGILVIANGVLISNKLPNLSGIWHYHWDDDDIIELRVADTEIRNLGKIIERLDCEVGDRMELIFNTWKRQVSATKVGDVI